MRIRKSIFVPVFIILAGVVLELNALGIFGNVLPADLPGKLWPLLAVAAALDLLFVQHRLIGSVIMLFFGAALLSTQFLDGGWNNQVWQIFMKVWPVLLILFGVDSIFSGRSLINTAVIIAGVVVLVYVALTVLDVPALKKLPIDLSSIIPTTVYNGNAPAVPTAPQLQTVGSPITEGQSVPPITSGPNGQMNITMPTQNSVTLNISPLSGKISLKAGAASNQFMSGTVNLGSSENLTTDANLNGNTAVYTLQSSGSGNGNSEWDLALTSQRSTAINTVMNSGYIKADLRNLNLSDVYLENKVGPIDVMVPQSTTARIRINAGNGDIRVYIPANTSINCTVNGAGQVDYPQMSYTYGNNIIAPRRTLGTPVTVDITSNGGTVRIIESE